MDLDCFFAIPGDIASPTGGYAYDRHILEGIGAFGVRMHHLALPAGFPFPDSDALAATERLLRGIPPTAPILIDGLAYGAMPGSIVAAVKCPIVALVHHPLAYETGLTERQAAALLDLEKHALGRANRIIVTGDVSKTLLERYYDVQPGLIAVAVPGTVERARARGSKAPVQLLSVGAISPRKGYLDLIAALKSVLDVDWALDIVGSLTHDPQEAHRLAQAIKCEDLGGRVRLLGAVPDEHLEQLYHAADAFVLSSRFEGFGMVLTEALARGLPIVTTRVGAADPILPDAAAIKVEPGCVGSLSDALRLVVMDARLRASMADAAWSAAGHLPRWSDTASTIAKVLREVGP